MLGLDLTIRANHLYNSKRGGTCVHSRHSILWTILNTCYVLECIVLNLEWAKKLASLDQILENDLSLVNTLRNFNPKENQW